MKSVILCEGSDDLWFISYYLYKAKGWQQLENKNKYWRSYILPIKNKKHKFLYMAKGADTVAIWCSGGKDSFKSATREIEKINNDTPHDPINAILYFRDRDYDDLNALESEFASYFSFPVKITINASTLNTIEVVEAGVSVPIQIVPIVIPINDSGAIETLLTKSIEECGYEEANIVHKANSYVDSIVNFECENKKYLTHNRQITKANYSAVIAITNPDHSTGLFKDMVMATPWETSPIVQKNFELLTSVITT